MKQSNSFSIVTDHDLYTNNIKDFRRVYLLLHGYLLDGEFMFKKLKDILPKDALIISPNGPFMIPYKKGDLYIPKFAWYFFNPTQKTYYINYEPAAQYLKNILEVYNPDKKPVTIIGYSQGGYLSPKAAQIIKEVNKVVGMACVFRNKKFQYRDDVDYFQIHGNNDVVVEIDGALDEWAELKAKGNQGNFIELADVGHKIGNEFLSALEDII